MTPYLRQRHFMVRDPRNAYFVGRRALLDKIFNELNESNFRRHKHRVALYGMAGIGKTQTALEYVHSNRNYYRSIFWISGADRTALLDGFREIASEMGRQHATDSDPTATAIWVLEQLRNRRRSLLIIDHLNNASVVDRLLPDNNSKCHTLITMRNSNAFSIQAVGVEVDLLHADEALEMFLLSSNTSLKSNAKRFRATAKMIVDELGRLPLAIEQAGAYIRETGRSLDEFLSIYCENRAMIHKWVPDGNRNYDYTIATVWEMSSNHIKNGTECPEAVSLLNLFAFLSTDTIPFDLVQAGSESFDGNLRNVINNTVQFDLCVRVLERLALVRRIPDKRAVSIHRLVQETVQDGLEKQQQFQWWETVAKMCLKVFPIPPTRETLSTCRSTFRPYEKHVLNALLAAPVLASEALAMCAERLTQFLVCDGQVEVATRLSWKTYLISEALGGPPERILETVNCLKMLYKCQGKWNEVAVMQHKALDVLGLVKFEDAREQIKEASDETTSASTLIPMLRSPGQCYTASTVLRFLLNWVKAVYGDNHPKTFEAMGDLALALGGEARWNEARMLQKRVLEGHTKMRGEQHELTLHSMNTLALIFIKQGEWRQAIQLLQYVTELSPKVLGDRHLLTLEAMNNLAMVYWSAKELDKAVNLQEKAVDRTVAELGYLHENTVRSMHYLAMMYQDQGQWGKAASLQEFMLENGEVLCGDLNLESLKFIQNLILSYQKLGKRREAIELAKIAEEATMVADRTTHPEALIFKRVVVAIYWMQGLLSEAISLQEEVVEYKRNSSGHQHPQTLIEVEKLGLMKKTWYISVLFCRPRGICRRAMVNAFIYFLVSAAFFLVELREFSFSGSNAKGNYDLVRRLIRRKH